jgi:hypothetical protein
LDKPKWFSSQYPSFADLESLAWDLGAVVSHGPIESAGIVFVKPPGFHVICLPEYLGKLDEMWQFAHEVGHLTLHRGYTTQWAHDRQEAAANRWAACALIPEERIQQYGNASLDAFIGALSAHYEDLPLENCEVRRLAAKIATIRLRALEVVA